MKNLFWNPAEKRMRALWRLILYCLLIAGFLFLFTLIFQLLNTAIVLATHRWNTAVLTDPTVNASFGGNLPLINALNGLLTLIAMLGATALGGKLFDRRKFVDFGFHINRRWWFDLAFGLFLGAVLMALIFLAEWAAGWIRITGSLVSQTPDWSFTAWTLSNAFFFLCVGIYEETFSRGYLLRNLAEGLRIKAIRPKTALLLAYLISSSIFGFLHLANANASLVSTLNLVIAGLFLGLGYVLSGELGISIGLHITWNFFQGVVFGFPVSGGAPEASFVGIQQLGPDWMTGGAFGPEAGAIGLIAILLGCGLIYLWVKQTRGAVSLKEQLAVYLPVPSQTVSGAARQPEEAPVSMD